MEKSIKHSILPYQAQVKGIIKGYASIFNILDNQGDRIAPGAFTKTLTAWRQKRKGPKMLWQHDTKQPIGIWTFLQEDRHGLYVEGRLALGTFKADEAYLLLKEGVLDNLSIGFRTIQSIPDKKAGSRLLLDIDLVEISLVTFGANSKATIHHIKTL